MTTVQFCVAFYTFYALCLELAYWFRFTFIFLLMGSKLVP